MIFSKTVNHFIENNTFNNTQPDINDVKMKIEIMDQKYIIVGQFMYTELEFIEIVKRHKSRNRELFNILKEYNPEYFI